MPVGREHLVAGEDVEIGVHGLHINGNVRDGLSAVDEHPGACLVRCRDDLLHRDDRAQGVGHLGHRDQASAVGKQIGVGVQQQLAIVVDGNDLQLRAGLLGELLPGHDVGVMLQMRDHDLVAAPT